MRFMILTLTLTSCTSPPHEGETSHEAICLTCDGDESGGGELIPPPVNLLTVDETWTETTTQDVLSNTAIEGAEGAALDQGIADEAGVLAWDVGVSTALVDETMSLVPEPKCANTGRIGCRVRWNSTHTAVNWTCWAHTPIGSGFCDGTAGVDTTFTADGEPRYRVRWVSGRCGRGGLRC